MTDKYYTYTKIHSKIRYLIACTDCRRKDINDIENELETYYNQYKNGSITTDEFEKLCSMVLRKILMLHDLCKELEWVN